MHMCKHIPGHHHDPPPPTTSNNNNNNNSSACNKTNSMSHMQQSGTAQRLLQTKYYFMTRVKYPLHDSSTRIQKKIANCFNFISHGFCFSFTYFHLCLLLVSPENSENQVPQLSLEGRPPPSTTEIFLGIMMSTGKFSFKNVSFPSFPYTPKGWARHVCKFI